MAGVIVFRRTVLQILSRCSWQAILSVGLVGWGSKSLAHQYAIRNNIKFYVIHATKFHALDQVSSLRGSNEKYVDFSMKNRLFAKFLKNYIISIDGHRVFVKNPVDIILSILLGYSSADKYWAGKLSDYPIRLVANQDAKEYVAGFLSGSGGSRVVATGLPRDDDVTLCESLGPDSWFVIFAFPPFDQLGIHNKMEILKIVSEVEHIVRAKGLKLLISPHPRLREKFPSEFEGLLQSEVSYEDTPRLLGSAIALISVASSLADLAIKIGVPVIDLAWLHGYSGPSFEANFRVQNISELDSVLDNARRNLVRRNLASSCEKIGSEIFGGSKCS